MVAEKKGGSKDKIAAVIKISSDALYLVIAEAKDDKVHLIENLEHPFSFAQDTFTSGRISIEKVEKTCAVLNNFRKLMHDYGVTRVKTIATTAMREAINAPFIIDQIKTKTKLDVIILDDSEEKTYIYKQMIEQIESAASVSKKNVFMAYIGSGSLGIAIYSGGNIIFSQNIRIGTMKLLEMLGDLQDDFQHFYKVIQEYLSTFHHAIKNMLPFENFDYFIACGKEIQSVAQLCKAQEKEGILFFSLDAFFEILDEMKYKSPRQISMLFPIPEQRTQLMLPFMGIYQMLLDIIKARTIGVVPSNLLEAVLFELLFKKEGQKRDKKFEKSTVIYARNLGLRFFYDEPHAQKVEEFALKIFDSTKSIHHLGSRGRLLLQVAAILHDIGKYIHLKYHAKHSFHIIRDAEILGLSLKESMIVANLAKYHTHQYLDFNDDELYEFEKEDKVVISKLLAMLKVADALDRAHSQKGKKIEISLKKDQLKISIFCSQPILLEKWIFEKKSEFFQEVFGIPILLKREDFREP